MYININMYTYVHIHIYIYIYLSADPLGRRHVGENPISLYLVEQRQKDRLVRHKCKTQSIRYEERETNISDAKTLDIWL